VDSTALPLEDFLHSPDSQGLGGFLVLGAQNPEAIKTGISSHAEDLKSPAGMPATAQDSQMPKGGQGGCPCPPAKKPEICRSPD